MCKACVRLRAENAPPESFPQHKEFAKKINRKSLDERIEERKIARAKKTVVMPLHLATEDVRRARIRSIREKFGMDRKEFAALLGVSYHHITHIEQGTRTATLAMVRLSEKELATFIAKKYRYDKIANAKIDALINQGTVTVTVNPTIFIPDNPMLRAKTRSMYVLGIPQSEIAEKLNLDEYVVMHWIADIDTSV